MSNDNNEFVVKLTALGEDFENGVTSALHNWTDFVGSIVGGNTAFLGAAAGATAVAAGLFGIVEQTEKAYHEMEIMSVKTGMSVEQLSLLKFATEVTGTSFDSLAMGVKKINVSLENAAQGNAAAATAFKALGLSVDDLLNASPQDRFLDVADALSKIEDTALRDKLATEIMGRGFQELLPLMARGKDGIEELTKKAKEMGLYMGEEGKKQAEKFHEEMATMSARVRQVGIDIGTNLLPVLNSAFVSPDVLQGIYSINAEVLRFSMLLDKMGGSLTTAGMLLYGPGAAIGNENSLKQFQKMADFNILFDQQYKDHEKDLQALAQKSVDLEAKTTALTNAEADNTKEKKKNADAVTAHAREVMADAALEKDRLEWEKKAEAESKALHEGYLAYAERILGAKHKLADYDDQYFNWYKNKLEAQGYKGAELADLLIAEHQRVADDEAKHVLESEKRELERLRAIGAIDDNYFLLYAASLAQQGATEEEAARGVSAERKKLKEGDLQTVVTISSLEETAIKGIASSIKLIWGDTQMTTEQAFKNAASVFVDTTAQMVTQAAVSGKAIELSMAGATAGISLVIGLIASTFSSASGPSTIETATKDFLSAIRQTLKSFEDETLDTLHKLAHGTGSITADMGDAALELKNLFFQNLLIFDPSKLLADMTKIQDAIKGRYDLEKSLINDITGILKNQKAFVSDVEKSITDVRRANYTPEQRLSAEQGDIGELLARMNSSFGQDKVDFANQLKQAYLAYWQTAQQIYGNGETSSNQAPESPEITAERNKITDLQTTIDQKALLKAQGEQQQQLSNLQSSVDAANTQNVKVHDETSYKQLIDAQQALAVFLETLKDKELSGQLKSAQDNLAHLLGDSDKSKQASDASDLQKVQNFVIAGLEQVKGSGAAGFDQLVQVNIDMLNQAGLQVNLQTNMVTLLQSITNATSLSLTELQNLGTALRNADQTGASSAWNNLIKDLAGLGINIPGVTPPAPSTPVPNTPPITYTTPDPNGGTIVHYDQPPVVSGGATNPIPISGAAAVSGSMWSADDAEKALKMAVGTLAADLRYDVNHDGGVTITDALKIQQLIGTARPFAHGGIAMSPIFAMVGDTPGSRGELIAPLEKMDTWIGNIISQQARAMAAVTDVLSGRHASPTYAAAGGSAGGNSFTFNVSFPNIRDVRDINAYEWEQIMKTNMHTAAERLSSAGHTWPMRPRSI